MLLLLICLCTQLSHVGTYGVVKVRLHGFLISAPHRIISELHTRALFLWERLRNIEPGWVAGPIKTPWQIHDSCHHCKCMPKDPPLSRSLIYVVCTAENKILTFQFRVMEMVFIVTRLYLLSIRST
jgi:hypothetical protein